MRTLKESGVFGVQAELTALLPHRIDTREQTLVEMNRIRMRGQLWCNLRLEVLDLVIRIA